jgi:hypothetical protein
MTAHSSKPPAYSPVVRIVVTEGSRAYSFHADNVGSMESSLPRPWRYAEDATSQLGKLSGESLWPGARVTVLQVLNGGAAKRGKRGKK